MDSRRSVTYLLSGAAVLAACLFWVVSDAFTERIVDVGQKAPDFQVVTESGKTITAQSFGGKLLVLNFWATWCPPCVEETPSLNEMSRQMASQGVVVLAVSVDRNENAYKAFRQRMKIGFETSRDPQALISSSFGTYKFPETYVITPDGKVVEKYIANRDWTSAEVLASLRSHL
jgi:cytochrome c biogenesis protein CcmG, thiol:disulfide interchange protein DsbE